MPRKRTKHSRTSASKAGAPGAGAKAKQLVVILNETTGEIAGLERIGPAGKRYTLPDAEIAKIAGDNELDDFAEVIEDAYAAGIRDGMEDALGSGLEHQSEPELESPGSELLRSGIRRFILRRALRRRIVARSQMQLPSNGHSSAGRQS